MPENVNDLPNVEGLERIISQDILQKSDKGTPATATAAPVVPVSDKTPKSEKPRNELGQFKSPDDLLKAYKEVQGFSTRMAQEKKVTEEKLAQLQERVELMQYQRPVSQQQQAPQEKDFDSLFIENPQQAVAGVAMQAVRSQIQTTRLAEVLDEENIKNPQDYQERLAYANQLSQQYPQLAVSPQGVRKLFQMADQYRKADYHKKGMAFVKAVMGDDVDFEKFKAAIKKDTATQAKLINNAYMPDTSTGIRSDTGKTQNAHDAQISEAAQKGDVDGVIKGIFQRKFAAP